MPDCCDPENAACGGRAPFGIAAVANTECRGVMLVYLGAASITFVVVAGAYILRSAYLEIESARRAPGGSASVERANGGGRTRDHERLSLDAINENDIEASAAAINARAGATVKRALDIVFSAALLVFLAPLIIATAIAIRIDSAGPILYRQQRVGRGGAVFNVLKFRSMVKDAEPGGAQYAMVADQRITRVGHIIRRLRIDEIPQTINVLRGEMSFVGPRPERPEFVAVLRNEIPHYHSRLLIKPGITGWAQVKYEYAASVAGAREKLRYDLFYISRYTPLMDVAIVFLTIRVVLFGLGSR